MTYVIKLKLIAKLLKACVHVLACLHPMGGGLSCFWVSHEREASLLGLGVVEGNNLGYRMIPCRTRDDYVQSFLQSSR